MTTNAKGKYVHLAINSDTAARLRKFGLYGDTWDMVVSRVLDRAEKV
jgi:hypothetical protein